MPDFQTFISILTALLVFLTGVFLAYDSLQFRHYQIIIPQWTGLLFAGITFSFVVLDQLLRGIVRLEETQRQTEEEQRRDEERNRSIEAKEQETRRTRIEARYRVAVVRFLLDPNPLYRGQLTDILALLEEYRDTL